MPRLLLSLVVLAGLGWPRHLVAEDAPPPSQPGPAKTASAGVTDEQAREFVDAVEDAIAQDDPKAFGALIDWNDLCTTATSGFPDTPAMRKLRRDFARGVISKIRESGGITSQILQSLKTDGTYRFLRIHKVDQKNRALFRMVTEQGLNYHDFVLEAKPVRGIVAVDLYVYITGELFSETLHQLFAPLTKDALKDAKAKPATGEFDYDKLKNFSELAKTDRFDDLKKLYQSLPESMQKQKSLLILWMAAAARHNEAQYGAAIETYETAYPNDPSLNLILIDGYFLRGKFDMALQATERLDRQIGGDPYLNVMRANIHTKMKDYAKARQAAEKGIQEEPDLVDAHWALISTALTEKDAKGVLEQLKRIDQKFELSFGDMTQEADYADFVKTPQHAEWKAYLKAKPAPPDESK